MRTVVRGGHTFEVEEVAGWDFWSVWADGQWEGPSFEALDRLLPEGGVFLDVGAWVGPYSLWAATAREARVWAMEPDPEALRYLRANIAANGLTGRVTVIPAAAAVESGEVDLWSVREWGASTSSMTAKQGERMTVAAVSLAGFVESVKPDLVKMDIEGGEALVFPAVESFLRARGTPVLFSTHWLWADLTEAWNLLTANWTLTDIDHGGGEVFLCVPNHIPS